MPNTKRIEKILQTYAIILSIVIGIILIFRLFFSSIFNANTDEYLYWNILLVFVLVLLIYLSCKPDNWRIFMALHIIISAIFFCGSTAKPLLGSLVFMIAWIIGYTNGFFHSHYIIKVITWITILFCFSFFQTPFKLKNFLNSILDSTLVVITLYLSFVLVRAYFTELTSANSQKTHPKFGTLYLQDYDFSERELYCIYCVMNNRTYNEIANSLYISPSVIKKCMVDIFDAFEVQNKETLMTLLVQYKLIYPSSCNFTKYEERLNEQLQEKQE